MWTITTGAAAACLLNVLLLLVEVEVVLVLVLRGTSREEVCPLHRMMMMIRIGSIALKLLHENEIVSQDEQPLLIFWHGTFTHEGQKTQKEKWYVERQRDLVIVDFVVFEITI
jgi:hypothetical protein